MCSSFCFFDTFTRYAWFGTITQENNIILEKKNNSPLYIIYNNRLILIIDIIIIQIQTRKEIRKDQPANQFLHFASQTNNTILHVNRNISIEMAANSSTLPRDSP